MWLYFFLPDVTHLLSHFLFHCGSHPHRSSPWHPDTTPSLLPGTRHMQNTPYQACPHHSQPTHRCLGALCVGEGLGQLLHICPTGAHLCVWIGTSEVWVAAPGRAQDSSRFWYIGVPCWEVRRAKTREHKKWLHIEGTPWQTIYLPPGLQKVQAARRWA